MSNRATGEKRASILNEISDWLKLLALIVLAGESLLGVAYYFTDPAEPFRKYYFPLMVGLFALIVAGLFLDRALLVRQTQSQFNTATVRPRQVVLVTRWYFKSGITEEELSLAVVGHKVTGTRKTRHPKGKETIYDVTGWCHTSTYWLEYHHQVDEYGGGSILLDQFTNDRLSGMVLSKDCDTGIMQCRANMWFPSNLKKSHKAQFFKFIGSLNPSEALNQQALQ
jgi:hypothetical protein